MLRRAALLAAGATLAAASPRHDPGFFDGVWNADVMGAGVASASAVPDPPTCRAGLCAGASTRYPTSPSIVYRSEMNIPELPTAFGPKTSLTDYLCGALPCAFPQPLADAGPAAARSQLLQHRLRLGGGGGQGRPLQPVRAAAHARRRPHKLLRPARL